MKTIKLVIILSIILFFLIGFTFAMNCHQNHGNHNSKHHGSMMTHEDMKHSNMQHDKGEEKSTVTKVNNKICPVTNQPVNSMGKPYQIEHKNKRYNLCCAECAGKFKKNPDKYKELHSVKFHHLLHSDQTELPGPIIY